MRRGKAAAGLPTSVLGLRTGHIVTLQLVEEMSPRSIERYCGPCHAAFDCPRPDWDLVEKKMTARNVELLPDFSARDGMGSAERKNFYILDPFGKTLRVFEEGSH